MPLQILCSTGLIKTCFSGMPIKQEVAYFISSFAYNKAQTVISLNKKIIDALTLSQLSFSLPKVAL